MVTRNEPLHYELRLMSTISGVGHFACCPAVEMSMDAALAHLRVRPNDQFMHKHVLDRIVECDAHLVAQLIEAARHDPVFLAILCEAVLVDDKFNSLRECFTGEQASELAAYTPLIYIQSSLLGERELHQRWTDLLRQNIVEHKPLTALSHQQLPLPFAAERLTAAAPPVHVKQVADHAAFARQPDSEPTRSAEDTARIALERLQAVGALAGAEMRHASSLSPHGFYRKWRLALSVENGRHHFTLSGIQTSYGRGLHEAGARASYAMEMVERCSSFASFDQRGAVGFAASYPLVCARYEELTGEQTAVLDPNSLQLEVPYGNQPLYWLAGVQAKPGGGRPILVPAQCVFLFCNLDEISLFSGLGSTGLASGNSPEQARVSALLEVIERDAEAVTPYRPSRCFRLQAEDVVVAALLADYRCRGVHVGFQDISQEFGVPCYKCFVIGPGGQIVKGTGAHLDGKRAVLAALTETPYPHPKGPASAPLPDGLPTMRLEDLPDYSTGSSAQDLAILEAVLAGNGCFPIYVDLTRRDIGIPVVKALVPGLELMADFDRFSRVSPRLLRPVVGDRDRPARAS